MSHFIRHRQQLIQQMQMIGSGAIGPQAANAIRHVAAQNGVWSLGKFGGVPPRTAAAHDQQQAQAGLTGVGQQQQSQQGNQQSAFLKSIDDNDYRFIFNSCSIPMVRSIITFILVIATTNIAQHFCSVMLSGVRRLLQWVEHL